MIIINIMGNNTIITEPITNNRSFGDLLSVIIIFGIMCCCVCHQHCKEKCDKNKQNNQQTFTSKV